VRAEGHAGDDTEPAAAALESPEQVGIRAGVGDSDLAVGPDRRDERGPQGTAPVPKSRRQGR
jgi:hypothetical protein